MTGVIILSVVVAYEVVSRLIEAQEVKAAAEKTKGMAAELEGVDEVFPISARSGEGLDALVERLGERVLVVVGEARGRGDPDPVAVAEEDGAAVETGEDDDTGYDECIVPCDMNLITGQPSLIILFLSWLT